ncbi:hypothetical protein V2O64_07285 [Verrucomicrobiaceae bacterium 227]
MSAIAERKQNIKVNETQLEIPAEGPAFTEDFEGKLADAQSQLELLQTQRRELERQKLALEDLNHRKQEFLNGQLDLSERYAAAITSLERELYLSKQEIDDLEQTRKSFVNHLQRIEALNPEAWPKESLNTELQQALVTLDKAEDEYEQAVSYFTGTRKSSVFGGPTTSNRSHFGGGDFQTMLRNGLAFNLPVIVLGSFALLAYLLK